MKDMFTLLTLIYTYTIQYSELGTDNGRIERLLRPSINNQHPTTRNQQQHAPTATLDNLYCSVSSRQPTHLPGKNKQQHLTSQIKPITHNRQQTADSQQPIANNRQPTPIANNRHPTTDGQQLSCDKKPKKYGIRLKFLF